LGRVELVSIPIGHAGGTTLSDTATDIATALAKVHPSIAAKWRQKATRYKT
jgi:hypothetical protein